MGKWQPIETAPKDGTTVLLVSVVTNWVGERVVDYQTARYCKYFDLEGEISRWVSTAYDGTFLGDHFTHWMPLPEPPGEGE